MSVLTVEDFTAFLREVYDRRPFPWQRALVESVLTEGRWPDVLDVPTGLGKTSVIDVAVFVAAARPDLARRRLFFVVDRRLIVDEAYEHASTLADGLRFPFGPVSARVAEALTQPGDDTPLQVNRMRGGVTWSWRWLDRPDRFAVVVGTVDQVGSRLLFRGYGVGEYLRPIDAALVGTDSLIVIDEAHLAQPFHATVRAIRDLEPTGRGPTLMTMSATSSVDPNAVIHRIGRADEDDDVAGQRLRAQRRMHLLCPPATGKKALTVVPETMAAWAKALTGSADSGHVIGVICNTVARARAVFDQITFDGVDRMLLTGRVRLIDRDHLLQTWYERIRAGRRREPGRPLIVVATQTIEVGANIDFDALVTESAALSALIQRLGRLNRFGELAISHALIVHDPSCGDDDPVYGPARLATWSWLSGMAEPIDHEANPGTEALGSGLPASPLALRHLQEGLSSQQEQAMRPPRPYIPVLAADVLDAWTRTSPPPCPDPPVAPYLHGLGHGRPDVAIVWRAGLPENPDEWTDALQAVPPDREEVLEVPLTAVRRWLAGHEETAVSDLEGQPDQEDRLDAGGRIAARYAGGGRPVVPLSPAEIEPGDTIVVRSEVGGCDEYGWNPASVKAVLDVADLAGRRDHPIIRLRPELLTTVGHYYPDLVPALTEFVAMGADSEEIPAPADFRSVLSAIGNPDRPFLDNLSLLAKDCTLLSYPDMRGHSVITLAGRGGGHRGDQGALESATGARKRIGLHAHQGAVAVRAAEFARNLHMPEPLVAAVAKAAEWHDNGKQDPRFQAMLYQRPLHAHHDSPLLAKSGMDSADRDAFRQARLMAGYSDGMRHEALSAQIAQAMSGEPDDLIVHLVATHHGRGRPLLPPIHDPDPQQVTIAIDGVEIVLSTERTVDWTSPARFVRLSAAHGRWRLALMETIVRLADMWCSEREEEHEEYTA
ncbi:type I-U CRISPR-associated helicase/endonuclease Cas3 [Actinomadura sp. DC4]|uniref:type I-G CRISPR-associated helicase/endonuclease Cas3g n=1 Tax=Actinomadura sp. DC4 TaxID=3055069 RepID=UPI0025AF0D32|nr:type I-U CRISPR-associated helicase/endonuclease Cas3 [Actinomadura sp. DC4]MDN3360102.1 type I-U CRISPR-associated helicase/endonuclease Cas3 [Actinomadura sp. DC4]